jgi:16S rRNA (uracil1498-N3)-methyltransferase
MTRRRWIADEVAGDSAALVGKQAGHLARVLRARVGQEFDIAAGARVRRGRITSVSPERVEFALAEDIAAPRAAEIYLVLAIFKFDRMEWAIEKATELGAARIIPVAARRSDPHLSAAARKRVDRWRRIAREAAQQARRATPPEIADPASLQEVIARPGGTRIVLAETNNHVTLTSALDQAQEPVLLAVGPEGGWTEAELKTFVEAGWTAATLGVNILRAETAAVAALAIASQMLSS